MSGPMGQAQTRTLLAMATNTIAFWKESFEARSLHHLRDHLLINIQWDVCSKVFLTYTHLQPPIRDERVH